MKLPARAAPVVQGLLLTLLMTFVVSGVSTLWALGPTTEVLRRWPEAWGMSWVVAFPTMLVVMPLARRVVVRLVAAP